MVICSGGCGRQDTCLGLRIGNLDTLWCSRDGDLLSKCGRLTHSLRLGLSIAIMCFMVPSHFGAEGLTPDGLVSA